MAPRGRATKGPTLIQTPGVRVALQRIQADVDDRTRDARRFIGFEATERIRSRSSLVNVDTGHMRRSFKFKVAKGNNRIDIFNTATSSKGFRYPLLIEKRFRGVERTIQRDRRRISRYAELRLKDKGRAPSGRMRNELG